MRPILPLILIGLTLLGACDAQQGPASSSYREPYYQEVEDLHIHWADLFSQDAAHYYAYVYSVTCIPCSSLRQKAIAFAQSSDIPFYFVDPNDDIPFVNDVGLAEASLGAKTLEGVCCYSTPTLIEITDNTVTDYSRDYSYIKNFFGVDEGLEEPHENLDS